MFHAPILSGIRAAASRKRKSSAWPIASHYLFEDAYEKVIPRIREFLLENPRVKRKRLRLLRIRSQSSKLSAVSKFPKRRPAVAVLDRQLTTDDATDNDSRLLRLQAVDVFDLEFGFPHAIHLLRIDGTLYEDDCVPAQPAQLRMVGERDTSAINVLRILFRIVDDVPLLMFLVKIDDTAKPAEFFFIVVIGIGPVVCVRFNRTRVGLIRIRVAHILCGDLKNVLGWKPGFVKGVVFVFDEILALESFRLVSFESVFWNFEDSEAIACELFRRVCVVRNGFIARIIRQSCRTFWDCTAALKWTLP